MKFLYTFIILFFSVVSANAKDWKGLWITSGSCQSETKSWLCFRKSVELPAMDGTPVYADIAVDSKYWMWINGELVVFEGGLKRGPNPNDTYYDRVDIAPYLTEGKNSIAILLWYFGKDGFSHNSSGRAGLLFDCQTEKFEILSDASWRCKPYEAYGQTGEPHLGTSHRRHPLRIHQGRPPTQGKENPHQLRSTRRNHRMGDEERQAPIV